MALLNIGSVPDYRNKLDGSSIVSCSSLTISSGGLVTAINGGTTGLTIGSGATDKLGFYGTPPIVKPTLATADAAGIITALVALGLVVNAS